MDAQRESEPTLAADGLRGPTEEVRKKYVAITLIFSAPLPVLLCRWALTAAEDGAPLLGRGVGVEVPKVRNGCVHVDRTGSSPKIDVPVQGRGASRILRHRADGVVPAPGHRRVGIGAAGGGPLAG